MRRPLALPILTALLLLLALALILANGEGDSTPPATPPETDTLPTPTPLAAPAPTPSTRTTAAAPTPSLAEPTPHRTYPATRTHSLIHGQVVDSEALPVADVEVHLRPSFGGLHPLLAIADDRTTPPPTRTAADGTFHFADVPSGPWTAIASSTDDREGKSELTAPHIPHDPPVVVVLDRVPALPDLTVVVLEPDRASPVRAATVVVHRLTDLRSIVDETDVPFANVTTDDRGCATIPHAPRDPLFVLARDDAGRASAQLLDKPTARQPRREVQLVLGAAVLVRGTFVGVDDELLRGSRVRAVKCPSPWNPHRTCEGFAWSVPVEGHAFAFANLPAGGHALVLESPQGVRLELPERRDLPNSVDPWILHVPDSGPAGGIDLPPMRVTAGAVLRGLVVTEDGAPVRSARVDLCLAPRTSNEPDGFEIYGAHVWRLDFDSHLARNHPEAHRVALTDASGSYELRGLHPGKWRVDVFAAGLSHDQRCQVPVTLEETTELRHELEPAGVLQVVTDDLSYLGIAKPGEKDAKQMAIGSHGRFTFAGLAAGEWALCTPGNRYDEPMRELARATVEAGRTTLVDLRTEGHVEIAGRVVFADGTPVDGTAQLYEHKVRLRPDGTFAFRLRHQLGRTFGLPHLNVKWQWLSQRFPLPEAALEVDRWSGEFFVGAESVRVTARDADGAPVAATVAVSQPNGLNGLVWIPAGEVRELKGFTKDLVWFQPASASARFSPLGLDLASGNEIVLKGEPTGAIDVRVIDRAGLPARSFPVAAVVWNGEGARPVRPEDLGYGRGVHVSQQTGENGTARLLVPPGLARVGFNNVYPLEGEPEPQLVEVAARGSAQVVLRLR